MKLMQVRLIVSSRRFMSRLGREREREREREVLIVHNIDFNGNFLDSMKDGLWLISDYMIIILKLGMLKNVRIIFVIYEMRYNL